VSARVCGRGLSSRPVLVVMAPVAGLLVRRFSRPMAQSRVAGHDALLHLRHVGVRGGQDTAEYPDRKAGPVAGFRVGADHGEPVPPARLVAPRCTILMTSSPHGVRPGPPGFLPRRGRSWRDVPATARTNRSRVLDRAGKRGDKGRLGLQQGNPVVVLDEEHRVHACGHGGVALAADLRRGGHDEPQPGSQQAGHLVWGQHGHQREGGRERRVLVRRPHALRRAVRAGYLHHRRRRARVLQSRNRCKLSGAPLGVPRQLKRQRAREAGPGNYESLH
jgi:hypothetical protein